MLFLVPPCETFLSMYLITEVSGILAIPSIHWHLRAYTIGFLCFLFDIIVISQMRWEKLSIHCPVILIQKHRTWKRHIILLRDEIHRGSLFYICTQFSFGNADKRHAIWDMLTVLNIIYKYSRFLTNQYVGVARLPKWVDVGFQALQYICGWRIAREYVCKINIANISTRQSPWNYRIILIHECNTQI